MVKLRLMAMGVFAGALLASGCAHKRQNYEVVAVRSQKGVYLKAFDLTVDENKTTTIVVTLAPYQEAVEDSKGVKRLRLKLQGTALQYKAPKKPTKMFQPYYGPKSVPFSYDEEIANFMTSTNSTLKIKIVLPNSPFVDNKVTVSFTAQAFHLPTKKGSSSAHPH